MTESSLIDAEIDADTCDMLVMVDPDRPTTQSASGIDPNDTCTGLLLLLRVSLFTIGSEGELCEELWRVRCFP